MRREHGGAVEASVEIGGTCVVRESPGHERDAREKPTPRWRCALCHPRLRLSLPQELPEVEYCAEVMQDHPDDAECTVCLEAYEPGEVRATS